MSPLPNAIPEKVYEKVKFLYENTSVQAGKENKSREDKYDKNWA
jgi:hypothetical protein